VPLDRRTPDVAALIELFATHDVAYVVTGSTAALLHGVDVAPGDLDITPSLVAANLARLAAVLTAIDAHPDPDAPFGDWTTDDAGERRWVERDPRPGELQERRTWRPDPTDPSTFDQLLVTRLGALDVVPEVSGSYDDLARRATRVQKFGQVVLAASIADQLAALTVPRRAKDRPRVDALRDLQRRA
jgi:hypothetical protein